MRVKVQCLRSLCAEGLWWDFSGKIVPLNPPESGLRLPAAGPEGMGSKTAARVGFAWNTQSQSPLLLETSLSCWYETFKEQTAPSNNLLHL